MPNRFLPQLLVTFVTFTTALIARADFKSDYETYLYKGGEPRPAARLEIRKYHFVFVGGYANELTPEYFLENKAVLEHLGAGKVSLLFPSSKKSIGQNVILMRPRLLELYDEGEQRPLIIVAHSKGGTEMVAEIVNHPELVDQGVVKRVVAMQSPLEGCDAGDLANDVLPFLKHIPFFYGLASLKSQEIHVWVRDQIAALRDDERERLSRVTLYMTASDLPKNEEGNLKLVGHILLSMYQSESDGLIALYDQWLEGFGRVMGHLQGDHTAFLIARADLDGNGPDDMPGYSYEKAHAFTKAFIDNILKDIAAEQSNVTLPFEMPGDQRAKKIIRDAIRRK